MIIYSFENKDKIFNKDDALIVEFAGKRKVLSTAPHNGGYRKDLKYVFNHGAELDGILRADTYAEHIALIACEIGLNPDFACGISTAAFVSNASIKTFSFENISVTAVVTAGIDVNGGRAGDESYWHEADGKAVPVVYGTINMLLFFNINLSKGAMVRSVMTATEAKSVALQELAAPSKYSQGLATGSGTDGIIVVADCESPVTFTEAGKHFKLGELIGKSVIFAIKEALFLQTGMNSTRQFDVFRRMERFGISKNDIKSHSFSEDFIIQTILYTHLLDEIEWNLIPNQSALNIAKKLLHDMGIEYSNLLLDEKMTLKENLILTYKRGLEQIK